jgi:two-component system invasion response regulator UvrY
MINVVIHDHDCQRCEGLRKVFSRTEDIRIAAEVRTEDELWSALAITPCNAVILGVSLQSANGLAGLTRELHTRRPSLPVIILSMSDQNKNAIRVLELGTAGYLPLICPHPELVATLHTLASGGLYPNGVQAAVRAEEALRGQNSVGVRLSATELQVMLGLACELRIAEIAQNLHVEPSAFGGQLARVLSKLVVRTNAKLIRFAIQNQLLR